MREEKNNQIKKRILEVIGSGRIRMRPRWHFFLRAVLAALGGIIVLLAALYVTSLGIFVLRENGAWFVPVFGRRGWYEFFASLPWLLAILSLLFAVVLEILARRFSHAYRRPLIYSLIGIVVIVCIGGLLIAVTPLHGRFFRFAEQHRLPVAGHFYRLFASQHLANVHRGTVATLTQDGFTMQNRRGELLQIIVTPETRFPSGANFRQGDTAVIFGVRDDHTIHALGVRRLNDALRGNIPTSSPRQPSPFTPSASN